MPFNKKLASILLTLMVFSVTNAQNSTEPNTELKKTSLTTKVFPNKGRSNPKLGYQIQQFIDNPQQIATITKSSSLVINEQSKVQVYVKLLNTNPKELSQLEKLGFEIEITNEKLKKIQGWISSNSIGSLTKLDNVISVTSPVYGHSKSGTTTTQGDAILRSNLLRNLGITGEGVKVGIISDGSSGLIQAQNSGDLPDNVTLFDSCIPTVVGQCAEGTAMAEIIHDIAPDAELAIADGLGSSLEFIQRLEQLANNFNADIIVDDLGFLLEPYFEDGDVAQAVNDLPDNIIYVTAAGNDGDQYYQGSYTGRPAALFGGLADIHDFDESTIQAEALPISVFGSSEGQSCVFLQWNDPFIFSGSSNPTGNDYDLLIFDSENNLEANTLIAASEDAVSTVEFVCFDNPQVTTTYYVVVRQFSGADRELKIVITGLASPVQAGSSINTGLSPEGSIFGHASVERAITVGAINANEPGNDDIASFSSQGPVLISFPSVETRAKPDITGIDGVSVTGSAGFPSTFFGTSAAAPHIAGITALLKSFNPNATVDEIKNALLNGATDLGPNGRDNIYGTGRADALSSLELVPEPVNTADASILDFIPVIIAAVNSRNSNPVEPGNNDSLQLSLSNGFVLNRNGQMGDDIEWVIEKDDEIVLIRNAQNELSYQHIDDSLGASYRIWLRKLVDDQYQVISNVLTHDVPTSYPNLLVINSNFEVSRTGNFDETVTLVALDNGVEVFRQDVSGFFSYTQFRAVLGRTYTVFLEAPNNNSRQQVSNTIYFSIQF